MNESKEKHPWEEFLKCRKKAMIWVKDNFGYSNYVIARHFSMDEMQVSLILESRDYPLYRDEDPKTPSDDIGEIADFRHRKCDNQKIFIKGDGFKTKMVSNRYLEDGTWEITIGIDNQYEDLKFYEEEEE